MNNYEKAAEEFAENILGPCDYMERAVDKQITIKAFLAGCECARPKWISVKDRLPPVNEEVWCLSPTFGQHVDSYTGSTFKNDDPMKFIDDLTGKGIIGTIHEFRGNREYYCWDVTHWMPLLDKPEGEG